jgi:hypothetical protein
MKSSLVAKGYECLDPTDERARKGVLAVAADIQESDVVIANMWRESIGTIIGIIQARLSGIPVILIDPNYIDSPILNSLVDDFVVYSEEKALHKLENDVSPLLTRPIKIGKKRTKEAETFDPKKLYRSLKLAALEAGKDDPIFLSLLALRVQRAILCVAERKTITTDSIKNFVFGELETLAKDPQFTAQHAQLQTYATALRHTWEYQEEVKKDLVSKSESEVQYLQEIERLNILITGYEADIANLQARLRCAEMSGPPESGTTAKVGGPSDELVKYIALALGKRRALCVSLRGKAATFCSVFERRGITRQNFEQFFDEDFLDGKQSNLNPYLAQKTKSYAFVLYASEGLRHLSESNRRMPNLFPGAGPNDAVRKFLGRIRGMDR